MTDEEMSAAVQAQHIRLVARRIQALRAARGWSAERLAQEISAAGVSWNRQVVAKLENGRRQVLSFMEINALGLVFGVPPILFLFPVDTEDAITLVPGRTVDTWTAAKWFMGRSRLDESEGGEAAFAPLTLRSKHDALVEAYEDALIAQDLFDPDVDDQDRTKVQRRARLALRDLRMVRAEIRRHGFVMPALPEGLDSVDDRRYEFMPLDELAAQPPGSVRLVEVGPEWEDRDGAR